MIRSSNLAGVVTDPRLDDNPIVDCNDAFLELTGYDRDEVLGRNCRFLTGPDTEADRRAELRAAVNELRATMVELLNYRKDGSRFTNAVMIAPIFDSGEDVLAFIGSQADVSAARRPASERDARTAYELVQSLTGRQRAVVRKMAEGKMVKQIAHELDLSERTIKMHRAGALKALGLRSSAEIIRTVIEAGY